MPDIEEPTVDEKEINVEEKGGGKPKKAVTKSRCKAIVREVPRGLRNSKPPET